MPSNLGSSLGQASTLSLTAAVDRCLFSISHSSPTCYLLGRPRSEEPWPWRDSNREETNAPSRCEEEHSRPVWAPRAAVANW
eukprot:706625-Amphidinium_carterae.2